MKKHYVLDSLLLCMLFLLLGFTKLGAQTIWDGSVDVSWYDEYQDYFDIYTPQELAGLAQLVNSGHDFSGVEINLQDDIWLNADNSTFNNWTMIGGNQTATTKETYANFFCGTFHGNGHYIYNMYCNRDNGNGGFYFQAGLFGALKYPCTIDSLVLVNPITRAQGGFQGGLAACVAPGGNVTISKVLVINANINQNQSSVDGHNGCIIGGVYPNGSYTTYISNCGATGTVRGEYVGGLTGGASGGVFTNCYFYGTVSCSTSWGGGGIASHDGTANNCYSNISGGGGAVSGSSFSGVSLTNPSASLGDAFRADCLLPINGGYPLMDWMECNDPDCGPVTNVTISDIQGSSVQISWTASHIGTPDTYTIEYTENGQENWQMITGISTNTYLLDNLNPATTYQVRVSCTCDDASESDPTMAIFTTTELCGSVSGLTVSNIVGTSAMVSWTPSSIGTVYEYVLEYSEAGMDSWSTISGITETSYLLDGLEPSTNYDVRVMSNCDNSGSSNWVVGHFHTACLVGGDFTIGTGTATNNYLPSYSFYNYSYSQQLFLASEIGGPRDIESVTFEMTALSSQRTYKIYLMHTDATDANNWIPATNAQLMFDAPQTLAVGMNTFVFDSSFAYNGIDNLLLIVLDVTGSYTSGNSWRSHDAGFTAAKYIYSDGGAYSITSTPSSGTSSAVSSRNTVTFGAPCDPSTCAAPNVSVSNVTSNSADVQWVAGYQEAAWELEYRMLSDTEWISMGMVSSMYEQLAGLNANTRYVLRLRSYCGGGEYSAWAIRQFTTNCGAITSLPYYENFENGVYQTSQDKYINCWNRHTSDPSHYAYIGVGSTNAHGGSNYIDFHYTPNCYVIAVAPEIDPASYNLADLMVNFWLKRTNNTSTMLEVGVMTDASDATTFEPVDTVDLTATEIYTEITVGFSNYMGNGTFIAFRASNGNSAGFMLDDLTIDVAPLCSPVGSMEVSDVTGSSATITWTAGALGTVADYELRYSEAGQENWITIPNIATETYLLGGLEPSTYYDVQVQSNCENGAQGEWVSANFRTNCLVGGDVTIGTGTGETYYIPLNNYYRYSYSQEIFTATELGGSNTFSGISYEYAYSSPSTAKTNVNIYLGHTTKTSFASTSDFVDPSNMQLVYSGPLNCSQGWNRFDFDTVFSYNGTDNLVIAVDDNSYDYNGSSYKFKVHTAPATMSLYYYSDSDNPDVNNLSGFSGSKGTTNDRNNVILYGECDTTTSCVAPNMVLSNVTSNSVTVNWVPGYTESSWELEYKLASETNWTSYGYVSSMSEVISGLVPNSDYNVRMRSDCGGDYSSWTIANFTTECGAITATDLPYVENFDTHYYQTGSTAETRYVTCWNRYASDSGHPVYLYNFDGVFSAPYCLDFHWTPNCYNISIMPEIDASLDVSQLMASFYLERSGAAGTFEVGVMTDKDDPSTFEPLDTLYPVAQDTWELVNFAFTNYTGQGKYIAFKVGNATSSGYRVDDLTLDFTPTCMFPTAVQVSNITDNEAQISWTENGTANEWIIEYDTTGFTPGNGQTITATTNPYTLTGLNNSYSYDVYVRANCGGGDVSNNSSVATFNTEICSPSDQCAYTLNLNDSYGDGWNGNAVQVYSNGIYVNSYTISTGSSATFTVNLCDQSAVTLKWVTGSYASETSFELVSPFGDVLYSVLDGGSLSSGAVIYTMTANCVPPTCPKPLNLSATGITTTTAQLSWTENGSATTWNVEYGPVGFTPGQGTAVVATSNPFTLTGLNAATNYDVYVQSDCGGGDLSDWSNKVTIVTDCDVITTFPYVQDFDALAALPACWNSTTVSGSTNWTVGTPSHGSLYSAHSGSNAASFYQGGSGNQSDLQAPTFDLTGLSNPVLTFWYTNESWSGDIDQLVVYYRTSSADAWTQLSSYSSGTSTWTFDSLALPNPSNNYQIKFQAISDYGYGINLDDVTIMEANGSGPVVTCDAPTALGATSVTQTTATINWTAGGSENTWNLQYKAANATNWSNNIAVNNTPTYALSGLAANTAYQVRVQASCGAGETSDWTTASFTTLQEAQTECPAPANFRATEVTQNSVTLAWEQPAGTANEWEINYKAASADTWTNITVTTNPYTISDLTSETAYQAQILAHCVNGVSSDASEIITFTTLPDGIINYVLDNNTSLYPNPTTGLFTISNEQCAMNNVNVYDVYGKLLMSVEVNGNVAAIDATSFSAGVYFAKVETAKGVVTKRFVKK